MGIEIIKTKKLAMLCGPDDAVNEANRILCNRTNLIGRLSQATLNVTSSPSAFARVIVRAQNARQI